MVTSTNLHLCSSQNVRTRMCKNAWHAITGVGKGSSLFKSIKREIKEKMMRRLSDRIENGTNANNALVSAQIGLVLSPSRRRDGVDRGTNRFMGWLAAKIKNYADPMPHENHLVLYYPSFVDCWKDACMELDPPHISERHFRRAAFEHEGGHASIKDAIARATGNENYDEMARLETSV